MTFTPSPWISPITRTDGVSVTARWDGVSLPGASATNRARDTEGLTRQARRTLHRFVTGARTECAISPLCATSCSTPRPIAPAKPNRQCHRHEQQKGKGEARNAERTADKDKFCHRLRRLCRRQVRRRVLATAVTNPHLLRSGRPAFTGRHLVGRAFFAACRKGTNSARAICTSNFQPVMRWLFSRKPLSAVSGRKRFTNRRFLHWELNFLTL